ncbi:unnamed protein product [Calypogeia fissa]
MSMSTFQRTDGGHWEPRCSIYMAAAEHCMFRNTNERTIRNQTATGEQQQQVGGDRAGEEQAEDKGPKRTPVEDREIYSFCCRSCIPPT